MKKEVQEPLFRLETVVAEVVEQWLVSRLFAEESWGLEPLEQSSVALSQHWLTMKSRMKKMMEELLFQWEQFEVFVVLLL